MDARVALGAGKLDYLGKTVLDSEGQAFQLSGRALDSMDGKEFMKVVTPDKELSEALDVICMLMDGRISSWTPGQAKVIYGVLEGKTQQEIARMIGVEQSAINNRLRLADWKAFEKTTDQELPYLQLR